MSEHINNFDLSELPFCDRRRDDRRAEDTTGFCSEHKIFIHRFQSFMDKIDETDKLHEARMGKLEQQIQNVDKKVDDLRGDIPKIITKSVEDAFKTGVWIGIKKFLKVFGAIIVFTIATALVLTISPGFADFIKEIANNIGG